MKNLIKKNQLMITALAIMIAIAGYLQFAGTNLEEEYLTVEDQAADAGDASAVDSTGVITENYTAEGVEEAALTDGLLDLSEEDILSSEVTEIESLDSESDVIAEDYLDTDMEVAEAAPEEGEVPGEAVFTSGAGVTVLSEAKLLKEQTRAKNKETLLEIINSTALSDEQKQDAVNSMVEMTEVAEKEAAAEILLEAKGFTDVVVSINGDAVDVVVNAAELTDAQRAQIEDIVKRKTDIAAENIVISTVVQ
ncbi:MAG TPA: SpoIIIAH-like family protein [Candidatus Acetatifactor stercoripullorum]|uniref:SpoIIIAH-like family protein n=1 Tax=Candidatus Acetatifactor stercoripullorum TaxID=2838414 RepID=A0A9D1R5H1_9FIRM|nr:SpoIIIAH-like family protein [Candidatus Acetatifactor stercoripullorum]HIW82071.1 SpoIIIAH-like family protein [Candidatus Acetatifactor stercoripullorum]